MSKALVWARLIFMLPTHRIIRLAPGLYAQIARGMPDAEIAAAIATYMRKLKGRP